MTGPEIRDSQIIGHYHYHRPSLAERVRDEIRAAIPWLAICGILLAAAALTTGAVWLLIEAVAR